MRAIASGLAAHLAGSATTLCACWRVTRRDGMVLGFTDHDRDLPFSGTLYRAASGFAASAVEEGDGLAATASNVAGGFSSEAISEADLAAGRYDGARVEVFLVNWQAPDDNLLLRVQEIGEVTRQAGQFSAELRSLAHRLAQEQGRIFNRRCDAVLGDGRCRVDLAVPGRRATGAVVDVLDRSVLLVAGLAGFADHAFDHGVLLFLSGAAAGITAEIARSAAVDGGTQLQLWLPLETAPGASDAFSVTIGCDKAFSTCRDKFGNGLNFQGFPHMPGADFAYSYVDGQSTHDGGVLFS
ncbi:MAG: DUF2163 domain-containing protein [Allorhizobium sp.]